MDEPIKTSDPLFSTVLKFLGTLTGISTGVSILFSATGFLVLKANGNLLGTEDLVHFSIDDYLYEGSLFAINTFASLFSLLITWQGIISMVLLFLTFYSKKQFSRSKAIFDRTSSFLSSHKLLFCICCLFALLFFLSTMVNSIKENDLLFVVNKSNPSIINRSDNVHFAIIQQQYKFAVLWALIATLLILTFSKSIPRKSQRSVADYILLYFACSVYVLIVLLLPISYGKTVYSNDFYRVSKITLVKDEEAKITNSAHLWLIKNESAGVLLYAQDENRLVLINNSKVVNLTLGVRENIFGVK